MDRRRREFERLARVGDPDALVRFLREQARAGEISNDDLQLAAYVGYPPARLAAGYDAPQAPREIWLHGLGRWGREVVVRTLIAVAEASLPTWERGNVRVRLSRPFSSPEEWTVFGRTVVGRGELADLEIDSNQISRRHLILEPRPDDGPPGLLVQPHRDSRGETRLNGERVEGSAVALPGDVIGAADAQLLVLEPDPRVRAALEATRAWLAAPGPDAQLALTEAETGVRILLAAGNPLPSGPWLAASVVLATAVGCQVGAPSAALATAAPFPDAELRQAVQSALVPWLLDRDRVQLAEGAADWNADAAGFRRLGSLPGRLTAAWDTERERMVALWEVDFAESPGHDVLLDALAPVASLTHPGLARVVRTGVYPGDPEHRLHPFVARELIPGWELLEWSEPRSHPERAGLIRLLCAPLAHCTREGFPHSALGPESVVVGFDGEPRLRDLGTESIERLNQDAEHYRMLGSWLPYAPPEVLEGQSPAVQSDVYALGALLYRLTAGHPPYGADRDVLWHDPLSVRQVVMEILYERATPTPPRDLDTTITPYLEGVILRCLEKEPARRYANPAELAEALADPRVGQD